MYAAAQATSRLFRRPIYGLVWITSVSVFPDESVLPTQLPIPYATISFVTETIVVPFISPIVLNPTVLRQRKTCLNISSIDVSVCLHWSYTTSPLRTHRTPHSLFNVTRTHDTFARNFSMTPSKQTRERSLSTEGPCHQYTPILFLRSVL